MKLNQKVVFRTEGQKKGGFSKPLKIKNIASACRQAEAEAIRFQIIISYSDNLYRMYYKVTTLYIR